MSIKSIIKYDNPLLREKSLVIDEDNSEIRKIISELKENLAFYEAAGLSAIQLGYKLQIFVAKIGDGIKTFINPKVLQNITYLETLKEGCLSAPNIWLDITRPKSIRIDYLDENFNQVFEEYYQGIEARILMHEWDHLHGRLFADKISPTKKDIFNKKMQRSIKEGKWDTDTKMLELLEKFKATQV